MALNQTQFDRYISLVQQGRTPTEALKEAFPEGLTAATQKAQQQQQQQAEQTGAIAQIAGLGTGVLGAQAFKDVVAGKPVLGELRKDISGIFGGKAGTNVAQTAAENAAWNAGADAASGITPPAETGMFAPGSTLSNALGGAGVALGAYGAYKGFENKDPLSAGLGGAGIAAGLSQLGYALGPVGWTAAIGAPLAAALINKMGDKDQWKKEYQRKQKLVEQGIIPQSMLGEAPTAGRSKEQLVALEEQKVAQGQYGNPEFARTRDEKYLKPEDIWGYSVAPETLGKGYMAATEDQRRQYNQQLLNEGLVKEAKGQISYKDPKRAKEIWAQVTGQSV